MEAEIESNIQLKRIRNDQSNQIEFLDLDIHNQSARTCPPNTSRGQNRLDVVFNDDGPLNRSLATTDRRSVDLRSGAEIRLSTIESHLKIAPVSQDLHRRIKHLEDFILKIEQQEPAIARRHFHLSAKSPTTPTLRKSINFSTSAVNEFVCPPPPLEITTLRAATPASTLDEETSNAMERRIKQLQAQLLKKKT